ncbi:MAG: large repetitive protein, partial [Acidimicrobiaceae bacterium]
ADFGFVQTGTIGDFVWFDQNGDGVQDASEPGLAGVTVRLLAPGPDTAFGTGDDVLVTTTTGSAGDYLFTSVVPGPYRVSIDTTTLPGNMTATTAATVPVTLLGAQQFTTADFGFNGTGSIGDLVFHDVNGNGTQDIGDSGIAGVDVQLTWAGSDNTFSTGDDVVFNTTTDANGGYLFSGLPAGSYSVDPTAATGFTLTAGTDPTPVTLGVTQDVLTADFGYRGTASIGDTVFDDQDGSGAQNGAEPGLAGVTVTATWAGFDGTPGNGDDLAITGLTNGSGNYTIANLPPGAYSVAVTSGVSAGFVATTTAPISTTLTAGEVELTDDFGFQQQADLVITKTTNTPTVVVGDDASWTVTVANNGPATAASPIVVTDTLPAGTTFVSGTGTDWGCLEAAGTVTCTYAGAPASLANGGSLPSITITATVTASAGLTITNTASVTSPTPDPDLNNNTATDDAATQPAADITITKSHAGNFLVGSQGSYSILVGNNGPSTSAGPFTVTDALPAGLTFVSASGGPTWTCGESAGTITCTANGPLTNGSTLPVITVTVNVTTGAEGGVTNTAVVDPGATLDPDPNNNTSSDPTTVVPIADLAIVKTAPGPFVVGDQAGYTLNVTNNGPSSSAGPITVTDTLPAGLTFVSGAGSGWSCAALIQDITCTHAAAMASGASLDITITVAVDASVASVIDNTAIVTGTTQDPDPTNNTSTVQTPTTPTVDMAITKTHAGDFVIGTPATYTITVANNGPSAATGTITVHDPVPAGLTPTDATGTGWTCGIVAQDITCANDTDLASGASLPPITVTVDVAPAAYPTVTNTTTVDTPPGANETVLDNNTATDPATVASLADLAITKTHLGNFIVGTNGTYLLTVTNNGPTEAIGPITVTDTLMGGLGFVSGGGDGFTCTAAGQDVTCTRNTALPNGEAAVITLVVIVGSAAEGTFVNHADVASTTVDPDPNNNGDDDSTTSDRDVDLAVDKSLDATPVSGSTATWTIVVSNNGQSDALGPITVTDVLPDGLTFVSGTGDGWTCSAVGQVVTCVHDGPLAAGASTTITVVTLVTAPAGTAISNTATVSSASTEVVIDNNTSSTSIATVAAPPTEAVIARTGVNAPRTAALGGLLIAFGLVLCGWGDVRLRRGGGRTRSRCV